MSNDYGVLQGYMVTESILAAPSHLQMFGCGFQECSFHHLPRDRGEVGQPIVPCVLLFEDGVTFAFFDSSGTFPDYYKLLQ